MKKLCMSSVCINGAQEISCCDVMRHAQTPLTDSEQWQALVRWENREGAAWVGERSAGRGYYIGSDLPPIHYCPWCGQRIVTGVAK